MLKKSLAAALGALICGLFIVGGAAPAAAYPDAQQNLTVDRQVLYGGEQFTATATSNVVCDWTLEWNADSRDRTANNFVTSYTAPVVEEITKIPLHGTCVFEDPADQRSSARAAEQLTWERTIVITVLPRSAIEPPTGDLPNTGGPQLWMVFAGLGLAGAGWLVIRSAKRARV